MRIAVIGAGYVGLVAAACLADAGNEVALVERDPARLRLLRAGGCPIHEPGLPELLQRGVSRKRLHFMEDIGAGLQDARICLLAVGTPTLREGEVDLRAVNRAIDEIEASLQGPLVLLIKSTVPVGTHARLSARLREAPHPICVMSNPEFLREGRAVEDFLRPARVVIGLAEGDDIEPVRALYAPFLAAPERLQRMDPASAELSKYASNAMLAARISLIHELTGLCEATGGDIEAVRRVLGADPRIGGEYLRPSLGYGGSCLPKDLAALAQTGRHHAVPMRMVEATRAANQAQIQRWIERICAALDGVEGRVVAFWGLAFKAGTDDIRESAPLAIARALRDRGAQLRLHDPAALPTALAALGPERTLGADDPWQAAAGADALVIGAAWPAYRGADPLRLRNTLRNPLVLDGRNLWSPGDFVGTGVTYHSLGRQTVY